jgi:nucleotide-binding universal stress UspA family protein
VTADSHARRAVAREDFKRARRRAALQVIMAGVTGRSAELLSYDEVRAKLRAREGSAQVLEDVPLDAIVGSVGRYSDFTRSFLPLQSSAEERWVGVKTAVAGMSGVPPIEVYQIGEVYFVKDGNHRVSVARQMGASHIEAYVTEVRTKVPLAADLQLDDLIVEAEHVDFMEHTHLDSLRPEADLRVTVPGQYEELEQHIEVQHFLMGMEQEREISFEEAVTHWYDTAYLPVVRVIQERGVLRDFPGRTETDLYVWIVKHRVALERESGWEIGLESAAADLVDRFSPRRQRVVGRVTRRVLDIVTPDELVSGPPSGQWRQERLADRYSERLFADIQVVVNGQESGWHALQMALDLARLEEARLQGLHVVPSEAQRDDERARDVRTEFEGRCEAAGVPGKLAVEVGKAPDVICERARFTDLIVLSLDSRRARQPRARLGAGLRTIIRRCSTPVLVVPGRTSGLDRMLLAYDGSPKAEEALYVAAYLAGQHDIPLAVVTVTEGDRATPDAFEHAQNYLESQGVQATFASESGPVTTVILITAEESAADLVIMGGYGFSPIMELAFGSTVEELLRSSGRPILICR